MVERITVRRLIEPQPCAASGRAHPAELVLGLGDAQRFVCRRHADDLASEALALIGRYRIVLGPDAGREGRGSALIANLSRK